MRYRPCALSLVFLATSFLTISAVTASAQKKPTVINPPPTAQDWADIGKLPDWSGVWNPKVTDQDAQVKTNPPPWKEPAAPTRAGTAAAVRMTIGPPMQ